MSEGIEFFKKRGGGGLGDQASKAVQGGAGTEKNLCRSTSN